MNKEKLMKVLLEPRVTEKSTLLGDKYNQFVFKVATDATKPEIKKAVEMLFEHYPDWFVGNPGMVDRRKSLAQEFESLAQA